MLDAHSIHGREAFCAVRRAPGAKQINSREQVSFRLAPSANGWQMAAPPHLRNFRRWVPEMPSGGAVLRAAYAFRP
jgi:hypothetical protein